MTATEINGISDVVIIGCLQTEMGRTFDHNAEDFTLERIIEYGFDQFSEQIGDISGAATKELAIEQVCT